MMSRLPHLINMQCRSREATVAQSQSRSDCYPILLNMQSHSREAASFAITTDNVKFVGYVLVTFKERNILSNLRGEKSPFHVSL